MARLPVLQARRLEAIVPAVECRRLDAQLLQRPARRQMGLLDQADDLQLLGGGISHSSSPPSAIMLFLSSRNSSACSATTSFSSWASRLRSLTSPLVAARAVSPASRRLPASRNSLDQRNRGPRQCLHGGTARRCWARPVSRPARCGSSLRPNTACGSLGECPSQSARTTIQVYGFLSHLHSLMVTMSQKSSVPQAANSVSQALQQSVEQSEGDGRNHE